jgi:DNA-binding MarR family transcriptional regulator
MARTRTTHGELVEALGREFRSNSTRTVLFHAVIAERLGLNPSDHKCADLLMAQGGPVTPGRLAELTGLTTGAITGVLDRLERAGFISREHDPNDRRRILVHITRERAPDLSRFFAPLVSGMRELCARYTVDDLALILEFTQGCTTVLRDAAERLREQDAPKSKRAAK